MENIKGEVNSREGRMKRSNIHVLGILKGKKNEDDEKESIFK